MLSPQLVHLVEQAVAAHNNSDPCTVQSIFRQMHDQGFCEEAHILIRELNRRSHTEIAMAQLLGQDINIRFTEL